jgi:hypothetical protein
MHQSVDVDGPSLQYDGACAMEGSSDMCDGSHESTEQFILRSVGELSSVISSGDAKGISVHIRGWCWFEACSEKHGSSIRSKFG